MVRSGGSKNIHLTLMLVIYRTGGQVCPTV